MNHTQKFAELDKLVGGLKEVTGLPEKERNKTPQHKKWKSALNALPKKDQQEYRQQKYDEAVKDKKKRHQDLKELCEHTKLHPHVEEWLQDQLTDEGDNFNIDSYPEHDNQDLSNKRTVFFTFAEEGKKNKPWHLAAGFTSCKFMHT